MSLAPCTPPCSRRHRPQTTLFKSGTFRLSLSLASILFFHRSLHRFFLRLSAALSSATSDARAFRARNPRSAYVLTSSITPAVGAALAGLALSLSPADQTRLTVTIYTLSRATEFLYNALEARGYFAARPAWLGAWLMMPLAAGQLLHAFVFDRDCFPTAYGAFILKRSPQYIQTRPDSYPAHLAFPDTFAIVDALAEISRRSWPAFASPILFPSLKTLPASLDAIAPIVEPAHPAIASLSCAVLHPADPSCLRTWIQYYLAAFPTMAKFWTLVYAAFALPRYKTFAAAPLASLNALALKILRTSFYLTSAIGTAWGSVCLFQQLLPRTTLPRARWFLSGALAGCWAFLERGHGRSDFMYSARASVDSLWKVGKKKGWWRGVRNGDVLVFTLSLMVIGGVYERDPAAVNSGVLRKALGVVRGEGWVDRAAAAAEKEKVQNEEETEQGKKGQ